MPIKVLVLARNATSTALIEAAGTVTVLVATSVAPVTVFALTVFAVGLISKRFVKLWFERTLHVSNVSVRATLAT